MIRFSSPNEKSGERYFDVSAIEVKREPSKGPIWQMSWGVVDGKEAIMNFRGSGFCPLFDPPRNSVQTMFENLIGGENGQSHGGSIRTTLLDEWNIGVKIALSPGSTATIMTLGNSIRS